MNVQVVTPMVLKRPILVGGLGLTASLWLLGGLQEVVDAGTLTSVLMLGAGVWWWRKRSPQPARQMPKSAAPQRVERDMVEAAIANLQPVLDQLTTEIDAALDTAWALPTWQDRLNAFAQRRTDLCAALDRTTLQLAIAGAARTGKTQLQQYLSQTWIPGQSQEITLTTHALTHAATLEVTTLTQNADTVLYVVDEDLTESILGDLSALVMTGQRVLLVFNKQDRYLPQDRTALLDQMRERLQTLPQPVALAAIAVSPQAIKVRTHQVDGEVLERLETPDPEVAALTQVLDQWVTELPQLVAQTVMRQTHNLRQDLQTALNQLRRDRARPLVEQLQWTAAATAFASPVPSLDLLATVAINGQLVMDLSQVYEQPLNLEQAKTAAGALAELVVKLGLVEASTQLLTTALKSHAATFVVGGTVQGLSAAYLTHMTGESLMAYFETRALRGEAEAPVSATAIAQALQGLVQTTQQSDFLKGLVQQGIQRFSSPPKKLPEGTTPTLDLPTAAPVPMAQSEAVSSLESA
ncbi:MAG: DUF697 domain-containing protein [Cyanobacteria bacterium]|nr:DUF697 domain-containing protein [Cyanobacteriota bacterium]